MATSTYSMITESVLLEDVLGAKNKVLWWKDRILSMLPSANEDQIDEIVLNWEASLSDKEAEQYYAQGSNLVMENYEHSQAAF